MPLLSTLLPTAKMLPEHGYVVVVVSEDGPHHTPLVRAATVAATAINSLEMLMIVTPMQTR